jgi:methylmalonyl-CoA mutase cobalamin-binding subunit
MKKILGASIGNCIHVRGIINFLKLAEEGGYETNFLGPVVPVKKLIDAIIKQDPDIVAISYRLTPETSKKLFMELKDSITKKGLKSKKYIFGGTLPVAKVARKIGIFDKVFDGTEPREEVISYLEGISIEKEERYPQNLLDRIKQKYPYPLIRHHFGLPSLSKTIEGAKEIAMAKVLDILSLAPDQNAQECFFRPNEMNRNLDGAGGVPLRREEDLETIYNATRCGNYPLVRCYSGTRNLIKWAEMSVRKIKNCFGAIPLCWYSQLDGRSPRSILEAIKENQSTIKWYADKGIPVEVNESHQWALRECGDVVEVATAFLAAYNAKKLGVRHYVSQYMFNTPPETSPTMDLAKMLGKIELIESLHDDAFTSYRMVRTGLASMSPDFGVAKGQLASSIQVAMLIKPHIVHVVGYCEGDHAATPKDIIESCKIAQGAIKNSLLGLPDISENRQINERKNELLREAKLLLDAITQIADKNVEDPWSNPETLANAIKIGILDASHLKGNKFAKGEIMTKMINGACYVIDSNGDILPEKRRLKEILSKH